MVTPTFSEHSGTLEATTFVRKGRGHMGQSADQHQIKMLVWRVGPRGVSLLLEAAIF